MLGCQLLTIILFGAVTYNDAFKSALPQNSLPPNLISRQYFENLGGWLELHHAPATWFDARLRCQITGGVLASPTTKQHHEALAALLSAPVATWDNRHLRGFYIGVHATFSKGLFFSIEGVPLEDLALRWAAGEPDNQRNNEDCLILDWEARAADVDCNSTRPYVCLKIGSQQQEFDVCGEKNNGYSLNETTGRCYKYHSSPRSWAQAFGTCAVEGARLAGARSAAEADTLRHIFTQAPKIPSYGTHTQHFVTENAYIGVRDWSGFGDWQTIQGEPVRNDEAWDQSVSMITSPDHFGKCGVVRSFPDGYRPGGFQRAGYRLDAVHCDVPLGFLCEKIIPRGAVAQTPHNETMKQADVDYYE